MQNTQLKLKGRVFKPIYNAYPDFNILSFDFFDQKEVKKLKLTPKADKSHDLLERLKTYQRLLRLEPDEQVAKKLIAKNILSASQIADCNQEQFIKDFAQDAGGKEKAQELYAKAAAVKSQTMHLFATLKSTLGSAYNQALPANSLDGADNDYFKNIPSFQALFGSLNYLKTDEKSSIFSPAAYLVDLLRIINKYITDNPHSSIEEKFTLKKRRPDLEQIPLTAVNTNHTLPYLHIVNEVIEKRLETEDFAGAKTKEALYTALATHCYPFKAPFNLPLEKIRMFLAEHSLSLAQIFEAFSKKKDQQQQVLNNNYYREYIQLSLEEQTIITTKASEADICKRYGFAGNIKDLCDQLAHSDNFIQTTGLSREEMYELFKGNLCEEELKNKEILKKFYINNIPKSDPVTIFFDSSDKDHPEKHFEHIKELTATRLDRICRFMRLAKKLNWRFSDLNWILICLNKTELDEPTITELAKIKKLTTAYNFPLNLAVTLLGTIKTIGVGETAASEAPFDMIFNNPHITTDTYHPHPQKEAGEKGYVSPLYNKPKKAITWNLEDTQNQQTAAKLIANIPASRDEVMAIARHLWGEKQTIQLTVENLSAMYRYAALAKQMNITVSAFMVLLKLLGIKTDDNHKYFAPDQLLEILQANTYLKAANVSIYALDYICTETLSAYVNPGYTQERIPKLVRSFPELFKPCLVTETDFCKLGDDQTTSKKTYTELINKNYISEHGVVLKDGIVLKDLENSAPAKPQKKITISQQNYITKQRHTQKEKFAQQLSAFWGNKEDTLAIVIKDLQSINTNNYLEEFLIAGKLLIKKLSKPKNLPVVESFIKAISRYLLLAANFNLSNSELDTIIAHPEAFGMAANTNAPKLSMDVLYNIYRFKALISGFEDKQDILVTYLKTATGKKSKEEKEKKEEPLKTLCAFVGWDFGQCKALCNTLFDGFINCTSVAHIWRLKTVFDMCRALKVDVRFLEQLNHLSGFPINKDNWTYYSNLSDSFLQRLKQQKSEEEWNVFLKKITGRINERKRDALVATAMWKLDKNLNKKEDKKVPIKNSRALYEYLLLDVDISGDAEISYIKEALNTAQLYLQRCRLNLEPGAHTNTIPEAYWDWIMNYRTWEANRKVFLYPENYIDPSLRTIKTPLFSKLQNDIMQGNITEATVVNAYHDYFKGFTEVGNLEIVGSYAVQYVLHGPASLCLVGRTKTEPYKFYYRILLLSYEHQHDPKSGESEDYLKLKESAWWIEIKQHIHADAVHPTFAFNKLFIFWTEVKPTEPQKDEEGKTTKKQFEGQMYFSFYDFNKNWSPPQKCGNPFLCPLDGNEYSMRIVKTDGFGKGDIKVQHLHSRMATQINCDLQQTAVKKDTVEPIETYFHYFVRNFKTATIVQGECIKNYLKGKENTDYLFIVRTDKSQYLASEKTDSKAHSFIARLNSTAIHTLSNKLFAYGIDGFLTLETQKTKEDPLIFTKDYSRDKSSISDTLDFHGLDGMYFKEIFFHAPFLVASILNTSQQFDQAKKWYTYIFNPTKDVKDKQPSYWQYKPFVEKSVLEKLKEILQNTQEISAYNNNPFDPFAIAGLRIGAYEKAIVMRYIDNLLDQGDYYFSQYTWESMVSAYMLYTYAYDLLGQKPQNMGKFKHDKVLTFKEILENYQKDPKGIPQFLINLEHLTKHPADADSLPPFNDLEAYFHVPENEQLAGYWDRVEDRLYKIRHCLTIDGKKQQLPLFQPPISPAQLAKAAAAKNHVLDVVSHLQTEIPNYRFSHMLERARNITATLNQLGSALLLALEKNNAEKLALIQSAHSLTIMNMTTMIKEKQIDDLQKQLESLEENKKSAQYRLDHYARLDEEYINDFESQDIEARQLALLAQDISLEIQGLSIVGYLLPNIFGLADGGMKFGDAINVGSRITETLSTMLNQSAGLSATMAQYARRCEEWQLQRKMADFEASQISHQIAATNIRRNIAKQELDIHTKQIKQMQEEEFFLKNKFTNQELYHWMVNRIATLYFQTYKIALEMSLAAQTAYQFELNTDDRYIAYGYWDSLNKGLMAGESLMLSLEQLEKAYLENNVRDLEIEKTISLREHLKEEGFKQGLNKGLLKFDLPHKLFYDDFSSHFCRKIKSISISIPAIVGPYKNINATLRQMSNKIIIKPVSKAIEKIKTPHPTHADGGDDTDSVRYNWGVTQQVAITKAVSDSGMFVLNFRDERYLPFEGTGVISAWELHIPKEKNKIDFSTISDVIVKILYTAKDGGAKYGAEVKKVYNPTG